MTTVLGATGKSTQKCILEPQEFQLAFKQALVGEICLTLSLVFILSLLDGAQKVGWSYFTISFDLLLSKSIGSNNSVWRQFEIFHTIKIPPLLKRRPMTTRQVGSWK